MNEVVLHSTQQMSDADLDAIAGLSEDIDSSRVRRFRKFARESRHYRGARQRQGVANRGAEVYDDNCAACHRTDGEGSPTVLPKIAGNPSVLADDPDSLIRLVLAGSALPGTAAAPSPLGMPGFAWRLSNDEVAQLLTFLRSSWGNQASSVSAAGVGRRCAARGCQVSQSTAAATLTHA